MFNNFSFPKTNDVNVDANNEEVDVYGDEDSEGSSEDDGPGKGPIAAVQPQILDLIFGKLKDAMVLMNKNFPVELWSRDNNNKTFSVLFKLKKIDPTRFRVKNLFVIDFFDLRAFNRTYYTSVMEYLVNLILGDSYIIIIPKEFSLSVKKSCKNKIVKINEYKDLQVFYFIVIAREVSILCIFIANFFNLEIHFESFLLLAGESLCFFFNF